MENLDILILRILSCLFRKTDEYLRNIYGNYMEIPSKEQIKAREYTPYFLDFNLPYNQYIKKIGE